MDSHRIVWRSVLLPGVIASVVSACLVLLVSALVITWALPGRNGGGDPIRIEAGALSAVLGAATATDGALEFTDYAFFDDAFHAIAVTRTAFEAGDYPVLRHRYHGAYPGTSLKLVWRTRADPGQGESIDLNQNAGGEAYRFLGDHPAWRGSIVEIGVYAVSPDGGDTFRLDSLELLPDSWRARLASQWSDWTAFRGWTLGSINFLRGTPHADLSSAVPVAAVWAGLAMLLLLALRSAGAAIHGGAFVVAGLLPWLALDLQWQRELESQLQQTREQFGGKDRHEQHLADIDRATYAHIRRLREDVLPQSPVRILVLQDPGQNRFDRLKAQFYLLPHNVFNYGSVPRQRGIELFDYVLVLGTLAELHYQSQEGRLAWDRHALPVKLVDDDPGGRLYRITGPLERVRGQPRRDPAHG